MNPAIMMVIENSSSVRRGDGSVTYPMEKEAILASKMWRLFGGKYKDIPMYCICPSKKIPSKDTISKLENFGVEYIENYQEVTEEFTNGFWNKPLGCMLLEQYIKEDQLIYMDLDLYLLKEPPDSFFICPDEYIAKIPIYPDWTEEELENRYKLNLHIDFQGNTICSNKESGFYNFWWNKTLEFSKKFPKDKWWEMEEEVLGDLYRNNRKIKLLPVTHLQIDDDFDRTFLKENKNRFFFLHRHLIKENKIVIDTLTNMAVRNYIKGVI